jgi:hypothetical protein
MNLRLISIAALLWTIVFVILARAGEPPALNPFGPVQTERDDAVPGYVEMSDGRIFVGNIYMTRDKRMKLYDESMKRQREIPLRAVKQIEAGVLKEWMEKEWRFKELALDEKYYTGRSYPAREYTHRITLQDGRQITGPMAEIFFVQPFTQSAGGPLAKPSNAQPERIILHKRDKGEPGKDLKSLVYAKLIKLGEEALEEGKQKANRSQSPGDKK